MTGATMSAILGGVNASIRYSKWPVSSCPLMAGFWLSTEGMS
jgi:hypothetical protein